METLKAVLPLVGVVIGAVATYLVTTAAERSRWRRSQDVRWDDRRLTAYIAFGEASKRIFSVASRVAAHQGLHDRGDPLPPEEGLPLLSAAVADRAVSWEALLLLGGSGALEAARQWHRVLRGPVSYVRGEPADATRWQAAEREVDLARDRFYIAAREDLGVPDFQVSAHLR
ncbi:hypothetical protein [Catellatospora tritici]|uniref:hypothetical protein n=1 Tax=Catellatospora tritici TaxID=2851566 RepID=UPI001C2D97EF|nr:hypothetical protein [Catellatospora tritici]MBV1851261.1 hypothetical protein [Catellatospora tritici]